MEKIRIFEAFAGYGSQSLAMERLKEKYGLQYEIVGISEIDKYAIQAYNALHPGVTNYGDISKIDWTKVPDFDLFTMSSPCQDFSSAGLQKGGAEGSGTRSSLLWECRKAILAKKPKYILFENVKNLVSKKFLPYFQIWQRELESYGYTNFTQVLDAKHHGIPQHRERVYMISILDENASYSFPEPIPLKKRLKDVLEKKVDEKYYLSNRMIQGFMKTDMDKSHGHNFNPKTGEDIAFTIRTAPGSRVDDTYIKEMKEIKHIGKISSSQNSRVIDTEGISYAVTKARRMVRQRLLNQSSLTIITKIPEDQEVIGTVTTQFGNSAPRHGYKIAEPLRIPQATAQGYVEVEPGSLFDGSYPNSKTRRGRVQDNGQSRTTLTANGEPPSYYEGVKDMNYRIRKLTPRECFRLMGVNESDIDKIQAAGISQTQQYKMAGNSIVVDVLEHIFRKLFVDRAQESQQLWMF